MKFFRGPSLLLAAFSISASALALAQLDGLIGPDDGDGSSSAGGTPTWVEYTTQSRSTTSIAMLNAMGTGYSVPVQACNGSACSAYSADVTSTVIQS